MSADLDGRLRLSQIYKIRDCCGECCNSPLYLCVYYFSFVPHLAQNISSTPFSVEQFGQIFFVGSVFSAVRFAPQALQKRAFAVIAAEHTGHRAVAEAGC